MSQNTNVWPESVDGNHRDTQGGVSLHGLDSGEWTKTAHSSGKREKGRQTSLKLSSSGDALTSETELTQLYSPCEQTLGKDATAEPFRLLGISKVSSQTTIVPKQSCEGLGQRAETQWTGNGGDERDDVDPRPSTVFRPSTAPGLEGGVTSKPEDISDTNLADDEYECKGRPRRSRKKTGDTRQPICGRRTESFWPSGVPHRFGLPPDTAIVSVIFDGRRYSGGVPTTYDGVARGREIADSAMKYGLIPSSVMTRANVSQRHHWETLLCNGRSSSVIHSSMGIHDPRH